MTDSTSIVQQLLGVEWIDEKLLTKFANDRILQLFYNCIYLGQWHLAVACLSAQQGYSRNDCSATLTDVNNIELVLRKLVENPYCSSLGSKSVPTPHHLSWLALHEINHVFPENKMTEKRRQVELRLLLVEISDKISTGTLKLNRVYKLPKLFEDLYKIVELRYGGKDDLVQFLTEITFAAPFLGDSLLATISDQNLCFQIPVSCLYRILDEIMNYQSPTQIGLQKRRDEAILKLYNLLTVLNPTEMNVEQVNIVRGLLISIIDAVVFHQMPLDRESILSSMLGKECPILVMLFTTLLSFAERKWLTESCISNADLLTDQSPDVNFPELSSSRLTATNIPDSNKSTTDDLLPTVVALMSEPSRLVAWQHLYLLCCRNRQHLLDLILVTCHHLIDQGLFNHIALLFSSVEFSPLRHLAAIVCLDTKVPQSITDAKELLKCVLSTDFQSNDNVSMRDACHVLLRQTELAEWYSAVLSHLTPIMEQSCSTGLELFHRLELRSGLSLLLRSGYLSKLDTNVVINALDLCPPVVLTGHLSTKNSSENGQSLDSEAVRDTAKYRGYLALDDIMHAILSCAKVYHPQSSRQQQSSQWSAPNNSHMPSEEYKIAVVHRLDSARKHVKQIFPLDFRFEIIENIYSLIFIRTEHLTETGLLFFENHQTIDLIDIRSKHKESGRGLGADRVISNDVPKKQSGTSNVHQANIACSENGRSAVLHHGFLATTIVIRDLLAMIQNCLDEFDSSIQECSSRDYTFQKRAQELRRHVEESLWRLGVLTSSVTTPDDHLSHVHVQLSESDDASDCSNVSTSTSGVSLKRRRRITEDQRIIVRRSSNIVSKMLNSPDGLLAICLREGRLAEASEVVKVCQISDSLLVSELHFVPEYRQLLQRLRHSSHCSSSTVEIMRTLADPSIKDLQLILSKAEPSALGASDIVRDFFRSTKMPSCNERSLRTSSTHCVVDKFSNIFDKTLLDSMVAFDVAIVSEVGLDVSSTLLHTARASLADVVTVRSSQTSFGICQFADYVLSVVDSCKGQQSEMSMSIACMLPLVTSPAAVEQLKVFRVLYNGVQNIMELASNSGHRHPNDVGSRMDVLLQDAVKLFETHLPRGGIIPVLIDPSNKRSLIHWNYVSQLLIGLRVISETVSRFLYISGMDYSMILQKTPPQWFSKLILDHRIHPEQLENSAGLLNIDLVECIVSPMLSRGLSNVSVSHCLPYENSQQLTEIDDVKIRRNIGKLVLNDHGLMSESVSAHPDSVTRHLLLNLVQHLKPWCRPSGVLEEHQLEAVFIAERLDVVLAQTCRLREVDLDLLIDSESRQERISFYLNLIALLSLHAVFVGVARRLRKERPDIYMRMYTASSPFWQSANDFIDDPLTFIIDRPPIRSIDRVLYESVMSYRVGQLGIVSLYDLKYVITRKSSSNPPSALEGLTTARHCPLTSYNHWFQYGCPDEPLLPFSMFSVYDQSPPLQVMHPEMLHLSKGVGRRPLLIRNASAYLSKTVLLDKSNKRLIVPELLFDCAPDIAGRNHEIASITMLVPCLKNLIGSAVIEGKGKVNLSKNCLSRVLLNFEWYSMKQIPTFDGLSTSQIPTLDLYDVRLRRTVQVQPWYASSEVHSVTDMWVQKYPSTSPAGLSLANALTDADMCFSAHHTHDLSRSDLKSKSKRLSSESLSYLRSHAEVWAVMCALSSERMPGVGVSVTKNEAEAQASAGDSIPVDLEMKNFLDCSLRDNYPILGRTILTHGTHLLGRGNSSEALLDELCSSKIPDDMIEIIFSSSNEEHLHKVLYRRTTQSLTEAKFDDVINELGILPTSSVHGSLLWTAVHDFALSCVILSGSLTVADIVSKISMLRDPFLRSRLCLKFAMLKQLDREVLYDMLSQFSADLDIVEMNSVIRTCIMELAFQDELSVDSAFLNLIQTQTMTSMYGKVELLCEMKKFDLARKFIDKTGRGTEDHCIVDSYIIGELLKDSGVLKEASFFQLLERMKRRNKESCLDVCMKYCSKECTPDQIIFFANFILQYLEPLLSDSVCAELHTRFIGYKILLELPADTQKELCSHCRMAEEPILMLEQLLMNEKMVSAQIFINVLQDYEAEHGVIATVSLKQCDKLIERHARLALSTDWSPTDNKPGSLLRSLSRVSTAPDHRASRALSVITEGSGTAQSNINIMALNKSVTLSPVNELFRMPVRPPSRDEWVPDSQSDCCVYCQQQFTLFNRRHHCRRCGRLLCGDCCSGKLVIDGQSQRACERCCKETLRQQSLGDAEVFEWLNRHVAAELCPDDSDNQASVQPQAEWPFLLTLDEQYNSTVRDEFCYDNAPSCSLAMSILRLHSNRLECARFIVSVVDEMMHKIASTADSPADSYDRNFIIQIAESLLLDAKLKFADDGRQAIFDDYLDRLKLIRLLVANKSSILPDINDLGNSAMRSPVVSKLLRSLIKDGQFELAMSVCNACNLNKADLVSSWGLTELRIGGREYWKSARDRFKLYYQIKPCPSKNDLKNDYMVENIVKILTASMSNSVLDELATIKAQLASLPDLPSSHVAKHQVSEVLDEPTYRECLFYIEKYGTYVQHIKFMTEWCHIHVACNTFLKLEDVSSSVFIESLVLPCLKDGSFQKLFAALKAVDPTLDSFRKHLVVSYEYFVKTKQYKLAYIFQDLLEDHEKAAVTCINGVYMSVVSKYSQQLVSCTSAQASSQCLEMAFNELTKYGIYLDKAKEHLKEFYSKTPSASSTDGVRSYMMKVTYQNNLMKLLEKGTMKTIQLGSETKTSSCLRFIYERYHPTTIPCIFGSAESQMLAVQLMLMLEYEAVGQQPIAIEVIASLKLDEYAAILGAACYLVRHLPLFEVFFKGFFTEMYQKVGVRIMEKNIDDFYKSLAFSLLEPQTGNINTDPKCVVHIADQIYDRYKRFEVYMAAKLYESAFVCATAVKDSNLVQRIYEAKDCPKKMALACKAYLESNQFPVDHRQQQSRPPTDSRPSDW